MRKTAVVTLFALAVSSVALGATGTKPTLRLRDNTPLTVTGLGFHRGEHVTVAYTTTERRWTHAVVASAAGSFTARFTGVSLNLCVAKSLVATGTLGSRAVAVLPKALCPPPSDVP